MSERSVGRAWYVADSTVLELARLQMTGRAGVMVDYPRIRYRLNRSKRMYVRAWCLIIRRYVTAGMSKRKFV